MGRSLRRRSRASFEARANDSWWAVRALALDLRESDRRRRIAGWVLVAAIVGMILVAPSALLAQTAPTPAASYAFNEATGTSTADASGHGLQGTLTNGATWGTGHAGSAVQLDGTNDFVGLGNPAGLQLTGSMTVSAWINSASFPADDAPIVSKRGSSEVGYQLDTTIDRGPRTIGFKLTPSTGGQMFRYGATAMQTNTWYHVAGVYNASTRELHVYLNGQLDDGALVGTVAAAQQNSTSDVNIGRRPTAAPSSSAVASTTCASTRARSPRRRSRRT